MAIPSGSKDEDPKGTVPNILTKSDTDANTDITTAKFVVGTVSTTSTSDATQENKVFAQDPASGTEMHLAEPVNYSKYSPFFPPYFPPYFPPAFGPYFPPGFGPYFPPGFGPAFGPAFGPGFGPSFK